MGIQINTVQMPQLRELGNAKEAAVDKGFKFTLLSQLGEENLQEKLRVMMERIGEQGEKISQHMDVRDVRIYRTLVSEFMNEIISNSHKFSRENFLDKRGRHRVYGIVRLVNQKIDELAQELLKSEKNHLDILERVGEIQGLLLDITT